MNEKKFSDIMKEDDTDYIDETISHSHKAKQNSRFKSPFGHCIDSSNFSNSLIKLCGNSHRSVWYANYEFFHIIY